MKRTVLRKRWASGESAGEQVVESELCTTAPGGLLSRDFHAVSFTEFHVDSRRRTAATRLLWRGRWELLADEDKRLWERNEDLVREILGRRPLHFPPLPDASRAATEHSNVADAEGGRAST